MMLGEFTDDYGSQYHVTPNEWMQLPNSRHHVVEWHVREQYLIARNDSANKNAPKRWMRIDWITLPDMASYTWAYCYSAYDAPTKAAAIAADAVVLRAMPRSGCNGYPFTRMRRGEVGLTLAVPPALLEM